MVPSRRGLDLDGCLSNFNQAFVRLLAAQYPNRIPVDFVPTDWWYSTSGLTQEEVKNGLQLAFATDNFWRDLRPYGVNVQILKDWLAQNKTADVIYITSRHSTSKVSAQQQTRDWLLRWELLLPNTTFVVVEKAEYKVGVGEAMGIERYIDDHLGTILSFNASRTQGTLLDRPWNRTDRPSNIRVVTSLADWLGG